MRRWVVIVLLIALAGCGRAWYRRDADRETYGILEERNNNPQWQVPYFSLNPNPTSRLYDPTNPDYPPMPPDDPAAYRYMLWVNGMRNFRRWHKDGDLPSVEDPAWRAYLPLDDKGVLVLPKERAVELAWINSREFQTALEALYLQALSLTFVRFNFALHWMGGNGTFFTHFGSDGDETNTLTTTTNIGFTKNLAAGGQFLANFINSFVFQFAGPDTTLMTSNLTFSLVQPLLQMAGRRVNLEPLTESERQTLYALRDFARFRKTFYVGLTTGTTVTGASGFLPLLNQIQNIRNSEANVASQEQNVHITEALYEAQAVSAVQVDQAYLSLQAARVILIKARAALETAFDNYKTALGLPPDIPIRLDESLLAPFQLTSAPLTKLKEDIDPFYLEYVDLKQAPPLTKLQAGFQRLKDYHNQLMPMLDEVQMELDRWKKLPAEPSLSKQEVKRNLEIQASVTLELTDLRKEVQTLEKAIDKAQSGLREANRDQNWKDLVALILREKGAIGGLYGLQTRVRVFLIQLTPVNIKLDAAVAYARSHRLDLMNEEARVVDAWRQIYVTANALRSQLNITGTANLATPPLSLNPVGFAASANSYTVGFQFNAPLNRLAERNAYRQSLINYQLLRRNYMAFDDTIQKQIRADLRNLEADRLSFEISRGGLVAAARAAEGAEVQLRLPPEPGAPLSAAATNMLVVLKAYDDLLAAKNTLIGQWVSYETDRVQLLLDLEALQVDEREVPTNELDDQPAESNAGPGESSTPGPNAAWYPAAHAAGLANDAAWLPAQGPGR